MTFLPTLVAPAAVHRHRVVCGHCRFQFRVWRLRADNFRRCPACRTVNYFCVGWF